MQITGNGELSLKTLEAINNGTKIKDIPKKFPVSLDQAKHLSRYNAQKKLRRNNQRNKGFFVPHGEFIY
ncbi:hypothetical protein, partial [Caldibacillus debilis]|uniref:hypothetical protein n=1 Tax=Caldibacillus debilis TaxID=301148 RepID=UPI0012901734